jgi:hypothetical protein
MARLYDLYESGFDPNSVEAQVSRDPLPEGEYPMEVESTELVVNRNNTGTRLDVTFNILDGSEHAGRKLFMTYNVQHENEQARQIGMSQLRALIDATGLNSDAVYEDSDVLLRMPFTGNVVLRQDTVKNAFGQREVKINPETGLPYPPRNSIASYRPYENSVVPPVRVQPPSTAQARPTSPVAAAGRPATPQAGNPFARR